MVTKKKEAALVKADEEKRVAKFYNLSDDLPVEAGDLLLSKLLCMQGLSTLVQEDKAKLGEIRDSVNGKLLCARGENFEAVLFKPFKSWVTFHVINGVETFVAQEPFSDKTIMYQREEEVDGVKIKRYECLNYYTLLPSEIKEGDYRPRVLSLRSTNYKVGKKIETERAFLAKANIPLPFRVFKIGTSMQKNDKGSWYIFDVETGRKTEDKELSAVSEWAELIGAAKDVKVDDSDLREESREDGEKYQPGEVRDTDKY